MREKVTYKEEMCKNHEVFLEFVFDLLWMFECAKIFDITLSDIFTQCLWRNVQGYI